MDDLWSPTIFYDAYVMFFLYDPYVNITAKKFNNSASLTTLRKHLEVLQVLSKEQNVNLDKIKSIINDSIKVEVLLKKIYNTFESNINIILERIQKFKDVKTNYRSLYNIMPTSMKLSQKKEIHSTLKGLKGDVYFIKKQIQDLTKKLREIYESLNGNEKYPLSTSSKIDDLILYDDLKRLADLFRNNKKLMDDMNPGRVTGQTYNNPASLDRDERQFIQDCMNILTRFERFNIKNTDMVFNVPYQVNWSNVTSNKKVDFARDQLKRCLFVILENCVYKVLNTYPDVLFLTGWKGKPTGDQVGHATSMYIHNKSKVVYFNSGAGISHHPTKNGLPKLMLHKNFDSDSIRDLARLLTFHVEIRGDDVIETNNYQVLKEIFPDQIYRDIPNDNVKLYQKPQISGSCTFYSQYWFLFYYLEIVMQRPSFWDAFKKTAFKIILGKMEHFLNRSDIVKDDLFESFILPLEHQLYHGELQYFLEEIHIPDEEKVEFKPPVDKPKFVEPKVIEPKVVEPKVVEPKVVEPKVVKPTVIVEDEEDEEDEEAVDCGQFAMGNRGDRAKCESHKHDPHCCRWDAKAEKGKKCYKTDKHCRAKQKKKKSKTVVKDPNPPPPPVVVIKKDKEVVVKKRLIDDEPKIKTIVKKTPTPTDDYIDITKIEHKPNHVYIGPAAPKEDGRVKGVWVCGETFKIKEDLKALGMRWNSVRKCWVGRAKNYNNIYANILEKGKDISRKNTLNNRFIVYELELN